MLGLPPKQLAKHFFVDPNISRAFSLPSGAYFDPQILEYELNTIFRNNWLLLPKDLITKSQIEALKLRRNAATFSLLGENYFLRRRPGGQQNSEFRCFQNACPHQNYSMAGQEIVDFGTSRYMKCSQHGLVVNDEGKFVSHPDFSKDDPRTEYLCLDQYSFKRWRDLLFMVRGKPNAPFEEIFNPMFESVLQFPLNEFIYIPNLDAREHRLVDGNWKLHVTNYMDLSHIKYIHHAPGGLHDALYMDSYKTELYPHSSLQWAYAQNPEAGFDWEFLPDRFRNKKSPKLRVFALWWFIHPNMIFNFYPWGLSVNISMPIPGDSSHIAFYWYHYVWNEEKYERRNELWLSAQVDAEDIAAMAEIQKNLQPGSFPFRRGPFGNSEQGVHWFHRLVYREMFEM